MTEILPIRLKTLSNQSINHNMILNNDLRGNEKMCNIRTIAIFTEN